VRHAPGKAGRGLWAKLTDTPGEFRETTWNTWRAVRKRYVCGRKAVVFAVRVPVGIVVLAPTFFALGRWL
jgi:hypothetical protein